MAKLHTKVGLFLLMLFTPVLSHTGDNHDHTLCEGFFPPHKVRMEVNQKAAAKGVDQTMYNNVINKVSSVYTPIVKAKGGNLRFDRQWNNGEVNAYASRQGSTWTVTMMGGLARHPAITADALALITCHEIGHHIGGVPRYSGDWASNEGQSDYFATLKCLRKVFADEVSSWNGHVDPIAKEQCDAAHGVGTDLSKICGRIAMASLSAAKMNQALGGGATPRFDVNDTRVVTRTSDSHPATQCRMDTYVNGALCRVSASVDVSNSDHLVGVCKNTELEEYGARARCWYKPTLNTPPISNPQIPPLDGTNPDPDPNPNPDPDPADPSIAKTPTLNGVTELTVKASTNVKMNYDVSNFNGVGGFYFEIIGPNRDFSVPNGVMPDPRAIPGGSLPKLKGTIVINPAQHLRAKGTFKIRIIPLDRTGRNPVGVFSNPAVLIVK